MTTPPKTAHPLYDTNATMRALNCSRWKVWDLCRNDPEFPNPRDVAGKNQWTQEEIEKYKASRPRRVYAAVDEVDSSDLDRVGEAIVAATRRGLELT